MFPPRLSKPRLIRFASSPRIGRDSPSTPKLTDTLPSQLSGQAGAQAIDEQAPLVPAVPDLLLHAAGRKAPQPPPSDGIADTPASSHRLPAGVERQRAATTDWKHDVRKQEVSPAYDPNDRAASFGSDVIRPSDAGAYSQLSATMVAAVAASVQVTSSAQAGEFLPIETSIVVPQVGVVKAEAVVLIPELDLPPTEDEEPSPANPQQSFPSPAEHAGQAQAGELTVIDPSPLVLATEAVAASVQSAAPAQAGEFLPIETSIVVPQFGAVKPDVVVSTTELDLPPSEDEEPPPAKPQQSISSPAEHVAQTQARELTVIDPSPLPLEPETVALVTPPDVGRGLGR